MKLVCTAWRVLAVSYVACERKQIRTRSETTAVERGKAAYLEIYANLQQGKTYFSITTKEGVQQYVDFRKRDAELGHIVSGRLATIATHLKHWLSFIGKDTKLKELERTAYDHAGTFCNTLTLILTVSAGLSSHTGKWSA
jgi:hypothetical protein